MARNLRQGTDKREDAAVVAAQDTSAPDLDTMISALRGAGASRLCMLRSVTDAGFWREAVREAVERHGRWGPLVELAAIAKKIPEEAVLEFVMELGKFNIHPMSVAYKMRVEVPAGTPASVGVQALERLRETAVNKNRNRLVELVGQDYEAIRGMVIHLDPEFFNLDEEPEGGGPLRVKVTARDFDSMRAVLQDGVVDPCWYVEPAKPVDPRFKAYDKDEIESMHVNAPSRWLANAPGGCPAEDEDFDL